MIKWGGGRESAVYEGLLKRLMKKVDDIRVEQLTPAMARKLLRSIDNPNLPALASNRRRDKRKAFEIASWYGLLDKNVFEEVTNTEAPIPTCDPDLTNT